MIRLLTLRCLVSFCSLSTLSLCLPPNITPAIPKTHREQVPLSGTFADDGVLPAILHTVPITEHSNFLHTTIITLGNPPQPIRVLLDINFSDLMVTSSDCRVDHDFWEALCQKGHYHYDLSASRTGSTTKNMFTTNGNSGIRYWARVTTDTLAIAGLEVQSQAFHEALGAEFPSVIRLVHDMDGILGLSIDDASPANTTGPIKNILERGLIANSLVGLQLGRWNEEIGLVPGELALGGVNEKLLRPGSDVRFLPVSNRFDPPGDRYGFLNGTWQVEAQSVEMFWHNRTSDSNVTYRYDFPADTGTARFDSASPDMALPTSIANMLWDIAKPTLRDGTFYTVPCRFVWSLPTLVFTLGGQRFVLPPEDYVLEDYSGHYCIWTIQRNTLDQNSIFLGNAFLRSFYVVLDRERRQIGFGGPAWKEWRK